MKVGLTFLPRALPWAIVFQPLGLFDIKHMARSVGVPVIGRIAGFPGIGKKLEFQVYRLFQNPEGVEYDSPGQRPGDRISLIIQKP
jgi:hypothetical protein